MIVDPRLALAVRIAREAGAIALQYFQDASLAVESKADASPVTLADRSVEQFLRERIADAFPADGMLGEEFGASREGSAHRWILDPIDGTRTFVRGVPFFGTLIGIEVEGVAVSGVIHLPALEETVYAGLGTGAWWQRGTGDPVRAQVSGCTQFADALFCTTNAGGFAKRGAGGVYERLSATAGMTRTWGDCYGYALVATGRAEIMVDPGLSAWDAAPLLPILVEAGGAFTDWKGDATIHGGDGVASNGVLHGEVLELLREA